MIDLGDGVEVLAIWFVGIGGAGAAPRGDWLGVVWRKRADDPRWQFRYRFRWHKDRRTVDSDDVKSWYSAFVDEDEPSEETLAKVDLVAEMIANGNGSTVDRILVHGDGKKALELMSKRPWAHVRRVPIS